MDGLWPRAARRDSIVRGVRLASRAASRSSSGDRSLAYTVLAPPSWQTAVFSREVSDLSSPRRGTSLFPHPLAPGRDVRFSDATLRFPPRGSFGRVGPRPVQGWRHRRRTAPPGNGHGLHSHWPRMGWIAPAAGVTGSNRHSPPPLWIARDAPAASGSGPGRRGEIAAKCRFRRVLQAAPSDNARLWHAI